ncbi:MAG TPA: RNA methyltransferase, partial [Bauldia sp.]|nr:RNA methyltransferase [Bauldia sp.]
VEIEREGERGQLVRVIARSPERVAPACPNFGACGICALEHMAAPAYLAWKREQVVAALAQRGIDAPVAPTVPIGPATRRRAILSAVRTAKGLVLGFHARASDTIVNIETCTVLVPAIVSRLPLIRETAAIVLPPYKPARVTVLAADNGLDIAIAGGGKPGPRALERLSRLAVDGTIARLTVEGVEVFRNRQPELVAGPAVLLPVAGGFTQAAKSAEDAMAAAVLAHVGDAAPVADLFAGIGTFTFRLAAHGAVTAVEGDAVSVAAIDAAARRARGVKRVTAKRRDLFQNPLAPQELNQFRAVVFDPPAAGAKAQAEMLARSRVPKVVAISCNPATLARDARILIDGGYRLTQVLPVDQFLFSAEIEAVASFTR